MALIFRCYLIVIPCQGCNPKHGRESVSLHCGLANVYILPDFEGGDTRSVEELVNDFVYQGSTEHSVLRQKATHWVREHETR